ncbi:MAG: hypothetical protein VX951_04790 [Planctomycetota bacterium]|nr:hypothetical protein [Planctomycetota bacterium]
MSVEIYRVIHLAGLILVAVGLGGVLLRNSSDSRPNKLASISHGVGLLAMLVAGFGLLSKRGYDFPWPTFIFIKIGIWLLLGATPALVKRGVISAGLGWLITVGVGVWAAYLGVIKQF